MGDRLDKLSEHISYVADVAAGRRCLCDECEKHNPSPEDKIMISTGSGQQFELSRNDYDQTTNHSMMPNTFSELEEAVRALRVAGAVGDERISLGYHNFSLSIKNADMMPSTRDSAVVRESEHNRVVRNYIVLSAILGVMIVTLFALWLSALS